MNDETVKQRFRYDQETGHIYSRITGNRVGCARHDGYLRIRLKSKSGNREWGAHRIAWFLHHGAWPSGDLDHINGNKHDNRLVNLRSVTRVTNAANTGPYRNNRLGLRGVVEIRPGHFRASIQAYGVNKYLGIYPTAEHAARVYDAAAREAFGEYARTNYSTT